MQFKEIDGTTYRVANVKYNGLRLDALVPENEYRTLYNEKNARRSKRSGCRKVLEKQLDSLWSKKVREVGYCEKCFDLLQVKKTNNLQAHHIFSRKHKATRWIIENGICLCPSCHTLGNGSAHLDPEQFHSWVGEYLPTGVYDKLKWNSQCVVNFREPDLELLLLQLK